MTRGLGMMSFRAISKLHFTLPKQTVNTAYYIDEILAKSCLETLHRTLENGSVLDRKMLKKHVKSCFYAGRCPYSRPQNQDWCKRNLANFWDKPQWPGNSPELNPIENMWKYLQEELNKMDTAKSICDLKIQLKSAKSSIKPNYLQALIDGMPERIKSLLLKLD